jgi:hypothetical protein
VRSLKLELVELEGRQEILQQKMTQAERQRR